MSERYTGGQAFPHGDPTHGGEDGMTLRDYFAAQAIAGICYLVSIGRHDLDGLIRPGGAAGIADSAYEIADAMLKAREA